MADKKPNILVIFGDDIGMWNVGAYTHGMMGHTPNIDRIAKEGMLFTDHYAQPVVPPGARRSSWANSRSHGHDHYRCSRVDEGHSKE